MEQVVHTAKMVVLKQGHHVPQTLLFGDRGFKTMILADFPNEYEQKIAYMYKAGKHSSISHYVGKLNKVYLVLEAWMVRLQKGEHITPPHLHPKRVEVLVISCLDIKTKEQQVTTLEYVRDAKGVLREIKDVDLPHGVTAESPLLPAFVAGYAH